VAVIVGNFAIGAAWSHGLPSVAAGIVEIDSSRSVNVYGWSDLDLSDSDRLREELHDKANHQFSRFNFSAAVGNEFTIISVPFWFIAIVSAVPLAMWTRGHVRRRHRRTSGLCLDCGYDLRATSDRCPECGAAVSD
jgi:hypothetical protein